MARYALLSVPFLVCLFQVTRCIEIQSVSEAQDALTRSRRAAEATRARDPFTTGIDYTTDCVWLTADRLIVRLYEASNVVILNEDLRRRPDSYSTPICELNDKNGTAVLDVDYLSGAVTTNITELKFSMNFFARNQMWYLEDTVIRSLKANVQNGSGSAGQTIEIKDLRLETPDAYAGIRNSFHCDDQEPMRASREVTANSSTPAFAYLWFENLRLQPFRNVTLGNDTNQNRTDEWGYVEPCQRAYTIGLLMATFTAFVMAAILALGIGMLTSVKTMDRFDDPKTSKLLSVPSE